MEKKRNKKKKENPKTTLLIRIDIVRFRVFTSVLVTNETILLGICWNFLNMHLLNPDLRSVYFSTRVMELLLESLVKIIEPELSRKLK